MREAGGQSWIWVHPNVFTREFELHAGGQLLATLRYAGMFGTRAIGESRGQRWTFTWEGVLRPRIRVRAADSDTDVAVADLPWLGWGGRPWMLRLADGRTCQWAPTALADREYVLTGGDGAVLLRLMRPLLRPRYRSEIPVEVAPIARPMPELPRLVLLARYLIR